MIQSSDPEHNFYIVEDFVRNPQGQWINPCDSLLKINELVGYQRD